MKRKDFNRMMHSLFGNSANSSGYGGFGHFTPKGRGKGKHQMTPTLSGQQLEQDFLASVRDALPAAATIRAQTSLLQSEWEVDVLPHQQLGP